MSRRSVNEINESLHIAVFGIQERRKMNQKPTLIERFLFLGIGTGLGAVYFAYCVTANLPGIRFLPRLLLWLLMMGGPIWGSLHGVVIREYIPLFGWVNVPLALGWFALPLIAADPLKPNPFTGALTIAGLVIWFSAGYISATIALFS
jgi:hypothetical protein